MMGSSLRAKIKDWMPSSVLVSKLGTEEPRVALTFDDGPDPKYTPKILEALKSLIFYSPEITNKLKNGDMKRA